MRTCGSSGESPARWFRPSERAAARTLGRRPGGIGALTDQHLASGIMWVPAALPYAIFGFYAIYRWLDEQEGSAFEAGGGFDGGSRVPIHGGGRRPGPRNRPRRRPLTRV